MVELAILLPVLMLMFMGSWTATALIGDNDTALQATRAGARVGAEVGDTALPVVYPACQSSNDPETCQADVDIIQQMLPVVATDFPNAVVQTIWIYQPLGSGSGCSFSTTASNPCTASEENGVYGSQPANAYQISGNSITPPQTFLYPLSLRGVIHPDEAELGVALQFEYTSPTLSLFTQTDTQYTVIRLAAEE